MDSEKRVLPAPGDVIAGKYELVRLVGEGAMGAVFEVLHTRLRQRLAMKILTPDAMALRDVVGRFEREARASAQLSGIHFRRVMDVDVLPNGLPYIVMELLDGHDLNSELERRGALSIKTAVDYVQQAARGMEEAHALGIIHRDLKPANLFLCPIHAVSGRKLVKVVDFGIAKVVEENASGLTQQWETFGTAVYMPPEQVRSAATVDARSDVWALGIILYELLTGRPPFTGTPTEIFASLFGDPIPKPSELLPGLPPELELVVLRMLEKKPADRYQSAAEVAHALEPFAPGERIGALMAAAPPSSQRMVPVLGAILEELGYATRAQLLDALVLQRSRPTAKLGSLLVEAGVCTRAQLEEALDRQAKMQTLRAAPRPASVVTMAEPESVIPEKATTHEWKSVPPARPAGLPPLARGFLLAAVPGLAALGAIAWFTRTGSKDATSTVEAGAGAAASSQAPSFVALPTSVGVPPPSAIAPAIVPTPPNMPTATIALTASAARPRASASSPLVVATTAAPVPSPPPLAPSATASPVPSPSASAITSPRNPSHI